MTEHLTFPADPRSVGEARRVVFGKCINAGLPPDVCDSIVLLTSETVTNAVLHGRSEIRLTVHTTPNGMRVEVGDDNSRAPTRRAYDAGALDGRGMYLVDALASAWGVTPNHCGKVVWFEMQA